MNYLLPTGTTTLESGFPLEPLKHNITGKPIRNGNHSRLACASANTDECPIKHRTYDIIVSDTPNPRKKIGILSNKPDTPLLHYDEHETTTYYHPQSCQTGGSSKVIGDKETHAKMTQKYKLCNVYHATHQSLDPTTRSVSNRQHKEHKLTLSPTWKETTTRPLHHGKHRNWWTHTPATPTTYQPLALNLKEWDHTYISTSMSWFYLYCKSVNDHYTGSSLLCNFLCNFSYALPELCFYGIR